MLSSLSIEVDPERPWARIKTVSHFGILAAALPGSLGKHEGAGGPFSASERTIGS
jgi:hypothetical protein